jgi:hypothetical protein
VNDPISIYLDSSSDTFTMLDEREQAAFLSAYDAALEEQGYVTETEWSADAETTVEIAGRTLSSEDAELDILAPGLLEAMGAAYAQAVDRVS